MDGAQWGFSGGKNMKKIIATLFALMLVASIMPGVFAARGSGSLEVRTDDSGTEVELESEIEDESENSGSDGSDDVRVRTRTELKDGMLRVREEYRDGQQRIRIEFRESGFSELTVAQRRELLTSLQDRRAQLVQDRRTAVVEIKTEIRQEQTRLRELRQEYAGEREQFLEARAKLKVECEAGTQECRQARAELNDAAHGFMGNTAEQMLRIIATTQTRVEANEHIDNETAAAVIAQLELRADAVEAAQVKIDALANSTELNETQAAADALRSSWAEARVTVRLAEGLLQHARYAEFLQQLEQMETRFTGARDELSAAGEDVTQLDESIASFSAKIDAAASSYAEAQDAYVAAMATVETEAEASTLLRSTRTQLQESHRELQEARNDLRAIIGDIRSLSAEVLRDTAAKVKADAQQNVDIEAEIEAEVSA